MKRKALLTYMRVAGYHDDTAAWVRLYVENHISRQVADKQWAIGQKMKREGVICDCFFCKRTPIVSANQPAAQTF